MSNKDPIKIEVGTAVPGAPVRVGKRLPGVSIGQAKDMLLGKPMDEETVQKAVEASESNHPDLAGHVPVVGALGGPDGRPSGHWGVFCLRCTTDQGDAFVYPCKVDDSDWPPQVLVPVERVEVTGQ